MSTFTIHWVPENSQCQICHIGPSHGHRLSDFCHFHYNKPSTADLEFSPSPNRWISELKIGGPSMQFGAFYNPDTQNDES